MKTINFRRIRSLLSGLFYAALAVLITASYAPVRPKAPAVLVGSLFSGTHEGFRHPAGELEPVKSLLMREGTITLIQDHAFGTVREETEFQHWVQNYLAPLLVSTEPDQPVGILYCSSDETAQARLRELGYDWAIRVAAGKGLIIKKT